MAKFVAFYNLCPIDDIKEFLGLSKDRENGNIVTTLGRNIIIVIKLSSQKQIRSWTVLDKLSSKVVYDNRNEQYVGVFSQSYLRCWKEHETDINKIKKIKFQKTILDLISNDNGEVLLLYGDGSCEYLASAIESRKSAPFKKEDVQDSLLISDPKLYNLPNSQKILTYFETDKKTQILKLVTVYLDENTGRPMPGAKQFKLDRRDQNISLVGQAVADSQNGLFLLTLWSDKRIFVLPLHEETREDQAPGNYISMIDLINVDSPVSILGVSKNCVVIYGSNSAQEGSSLLIYNTQFRVVNAKQFFKVYFNCSRLWVIDDTILLAMGQNLYVVSYRVSKELLSDMVGSQVSNDLQTTIATNFINEDDELEELLEYEGGRSKQPTQYTPNYKSDIRQADGKFIPYQPYDCFHEQLMKVASRNCSLSVVSDDNYDTAVRLLSSYNDRTFSTEELEIIARNLEENGASEQEITEKILTVALRAGLIADMETCIRKYTNVSQRLLAKVLRYALEDFPHQVLNLSDAQANGVDLSDSQTEKLKLLNIVLSCSVDVATMLPNVKKELTFEHVLILLQYLYNAACKDSTVLDERPEANSEFDEDVQIIQWTTIVLNASFQELGLSKNPQLIEVLMKWKEFLQLYRDDLGSLNSLHALLNNVVNNKSSFSDNRLFKWYSIEEVKLF